jgi:hypothetical protein
VADYVDKHLEKVANTLREALSSSQWIPESARPKPPPPPPRSFTESISSSASVYAQLHSWVMRNKILTTVIVIAIGGVTYHIIRRKSDRKKRRAKRAGNGARLEVVVIAGSPSEPLTRSISLDLERRGFIVYIVCNTIEEEVLVQNESRPDIKPLMIDIVDVSLPRSLHPRGDINVLKDTKRERFYRALHSAFTIPALSFPRRKAPPLNLSLFDPYSVRLLPVLTNRYSPALSTL